jgi:hypothetical protein
MRFVRTGAGAGDRSAAEKYLAQYIGHKYRPEPSAIPMIADMLAVYGDEVAPHKKSARIIGYRIGSLLRWWGEKTGPTSPPNPAVPTSRPRARWVRKAT